MNNPGSKNDQVNRLINNWLCILNDLIHYVFRSHLPCPSCLIAVLSLILLSGCAKQSPPGVTNTIIDGIPTRIYSSTCEVGIDPYEIEEAVVFGANQAEDTYLLSSAWPIGTLDNGILPVRDSRNRTIHLFAADGSHLGSIGGQGDGPGEFRGIGFAHAVSDQILVWDYNLLRLSLFSPEGHLRDIINPPTGESWLRRLSQLVPLKTGTASPWIAVDATGHSRSEGPAPSRATYEAHFHVYLLDRTLTRTRTLIDTIAMMETASLGSGQRMWAAGPPVFTRGSAVYAAAPDLPFAWTWASDWRIDFLDPETGERQAVVIQRPPVPVTSAMREEVFQRWEERELGEQARRFLIFAENVPPISGLSWDTTGRLWVRGITPEEDDPAGIPYDVFDREGNWLFSQRFAVPAYGITGSSFYSTDRDSEGNPIIRSYRLIER